MNSYFLPQKRGSGGMIDFRSSLQICKQSAAHCTVQLLTGAGTRKGNPLSPPPRRRKKINDNMITFVIPAVNSLLHPLCHFITSLWDLQRFHGPAE
jgi:hypothetical protein